MTLTAVSLFAGVGGIDLALERAGFKVKAAVEINKAARGVIADRMPETTLFNDVTQVTAHELLAAGFDPRTGVVCAGFPCQDLSVAGRRRGLAGGTRSGLYWHVVRLLADLRPRWVILENVPGLLSACCPCLGDGSCADASCPGELHPVTGGACGPGRCMVEHGGAMGAVLGSLAELGYGFAYRVLDAQHFGVPQRRRRVVIVGCLGDERRPVEVLLEPEGSLGDPASGDAEGARVAATLTAGAHGPGVAAPGRRAEDDVNLVVAPALTARYGKGTDSDATDAMVFHDGPVATLQGGGRRGHRIDAEAAAGGHLVIAPTLTAGMGSNAGHPGDAGKDDLVLAVAESQLSVRPLALRGREHGAELEVGPEGGPYNALRAGDGGSSRQSLIQITSVTGDHTHALTAEGHDASEDGTGRGTPIIAFDPNAGGDHTSSGAFYEDGTTPTLQGGRAPATIADTTVRRLTPRERERLQGFPDDWTATSDGAEQADSPRYQQMGNAVAVPVFEWVARRIARAA